MRFSKLLIAFSVLLPGALVAQTTTQVYNYSVPPPGVGVGYAPNGNILSYTDNVNGNWTMTYDSLNRLRSATATTGQFQNLALTMTYDSFGNRLTQTPAGSPPIGTVPSSWAQYNDGSNRITGSSTAVAGVAYDAAGNVLNDGSNQVAYDAEGRVCAVYSLVFGGNVTQYLYDAEGRRVAKGYSASAPSQLVCSMGGADFIPAETYILGQSGEQVTQLDRSGHWQHTNVYATGQLLATYDNQGPGLHFHVDDPLGTRRVQVSSTGEIELQCVNLPFGDYLKCNGPGTDATEHHFTGKERDTESGLDYFRARYYGNSMARFLSPDPYNAILIRQNSIAGGLPEGAAESFFTGFLENPQNWNKYSYVRNNPLGFTDPTGAAPSPSTGDGHHLIPLREGIKGLLGKDFANKVMTGGPNVAPNIGRTAAHNAYNAAEQAILEEAEQVSGDSSGWSLSQWKDFATKLLNSEEPAIKNFLDEFEQNQPGARAALATAIASYQPSKIMAARIGAGIAAANLKNILGEVFICFTCNIYMQHERVTHRIIINP